MFIQDQGCVLLHHLYEGILPNFGVKNRRLVDHNILSREIDWSASEFISAGTYGNLVKAKWRNLDVAVRVPVFQKRQLGFVHGIESVTRVACECLLLEFLPSHRNIVMSIGNGSYRSASAALLGAKFFVMDPLKMSLQAYYEEPLSEFNWDITTNFALEIAEGMTFLHEHFVVHRDLRCANIFVSHNFRHIKIADFTSSTKLEVQLDLDVGVGNITDPNDHSKSKLIPQQNQKEESLDGSIDFSPHYGSISKVQHCRNALAWVAPECLRGQVHSFSSDVFSYGMVLWEMAARCIPWKDREVAAIAMLTSDCQRPEIDVDWPSSYIQLMEQCWNEAPSERPNFSLIVNTLKGKLLCPYPLHPKFPQLCI